MSDLRGFTLHQPWASLIAVGAKRIETRSWATSYRGWLAIHAGRRIPDSALLDSEPFASALGLNAHGVWLPLGSIVAVAHLERIAPTGDAGTIPLLCQRRGWDWETERLFGDFTPGRFGWVLTDVQSLREPIPCRGAQGLWPVPDSVVAQILAQGVRL